tara:strand:- start:839 stop:1012 length:174 start_codon:yes stop_codon:yes gene_type:complete
MSCVDHVELIQQFPTGGTNGVCNADELLIISYMEFQVAQKFVGHIKTDFGHSLPLLE